MKKIIMILLGIILITGVMGASLLAFDINPARFIVPRIQPQRYSGCITFKADKVSETCCMNEPDMDIDDEFQRCLSNYQGQEITDARDWTGREYQSDSAYPDFKSFDEDKIRANKCSMSNLAYNTSIQECYNATAEMLE